MSYRTNQSQQISLFDHSLRLTDRERKFLEKSWAHVFSNEIFPAIDEERFSVLYSQNASRPNTPVNIIIGALIIKELFDLSDDEVVENLMLDIHYQYALHTTSYEEQPLSDKTLSRFRKRCYEYEQTHGIDIFHDCISDLNNKIAKLMGVSSRIRRMDSLMIEANIRRMNRIELLYSCVARLVQYIHKTDATQILTGMEHYCQPDDRNVVIYHSRDIDVTSRMKCILADADRLIELCSEQYKCTAEYRLLLRCLEEQTIVENGDRRVRGKNIEAPNPTSLQTPIDSDATFRAKAGKTHVGYIANIVEAVDNTGSVITDYQYEKNVYSDIHFLCDHINQQEYQKEPIRIVVDGAYTGQENRKLASEKNIEIINTALNGKSVPDIYADFVISENGKNVILCPAGFSPLRCKYISTTAQIKTCFAHETCINCPNQKQCRAQIRKSSNLVVISQSAIERAKQQRKMSEAEFQNWRRIRNGVESVPSILRNQYHVDKIPVRGMIRSKFFFGSKILAVNFKKLLRRKRGFCCHPFNPLLA